MILWMTPPAYAATDVGAIIENMNPDQIKNPEVLQAIAQTWAEKAGGASSSFTLILGASGGQFAAEVAQAVQSGNFDQDSAEALKTIFKGGGADANPSKLEASLKVASGISSLAAATVGTATSSAIGNAVQQRQEVVRVEQRTAAAKFGNDMGLASLAMNNNFTKRLWASPFHTRQSADKYDLTEGYKYKATGVSVGYDRMFGCLTLGAAFTFSNGTYEVDNVRDDNTIKNYGVSAYGQYYDVSKGFFVTVAGGYNYSDNDWNRFVESGVNKWDRGKNHTNSYWVGGNVGKEFKFGRDGAAAYIAPSIGLYWSHSESSKYKSRGVINRTIYETKHKSLMMPVDVNVRQEIRLGDESTVTLKANIGYSYNFKNDGARGSMQYDAIGSQAFAVNGTATGRHGFNTGAGVKYQYKKVDMGVDYRYDRQKKFDAHRISATVGLNF